MQNLGSPRRVEGEIGERLIHALETLLHLCWRDDLGRDRGRNVKRDTTTREPVTYKGARTNNATIQRFQLGEDVYKTSYENEHTAQPIKH